MVCDGDGAMNCDTDTENEDHCGSNIGVDEGISLVVADTCVVVKPRL